jgi:hypothetical protein
VQFQFSYDHILTRFTTAYEIKDNLADYLSTANVDNIRSVEDIVKFNKDNTSEE